MTREEKNKTIVLRAIEALKQGSWELFSKLHSKDFVLHEFGMEETSTSEDFEIGYRLAREELPEVQCTVEDLIAEGDKVAVRFTFWIKAQGKYDKVDDQGRIVMSTRIYIVRIAGGKIVEEWAECDIRKAIRKVITEFLRRKR